MLPDWVMDVVEEQTSRYPLKQVLAAYEVLSRTYRQVGTTASLASEELFALAYLNARLPATYASVSAAFAQIPVPILSQVKTFVDMGAGPGTATFALCEAAANLEEIICLEAEKFWEPIASAFFQASPYASTKKLFWQQHDLGKDFLHGLAPVDALVCCYMLGEIEEEESLARLVAQAWERTKVFFLVVEPGTMHGFSVVRKVRKLLLERQAHILAPCPHESPCPMQEGNWCHFATRVSRSSSMRKIKSAALGYEDEKFSYCVFVREPLSPSQGSRIVRHPQTHGGHVCLQLCTAAGVLEDRTVSKKNGDLYKRARKAKWGDFLQE